MRSLLTPVLPTDRFTPHDRAVTGTMWLVGLAQGFAQAQASATLPYTRAGLGISESTMSALLAGARLASFLAIGLSVWADRSGRRRPLLVGYVILLIASGLSGLAGAPWQFGLSQGLVRAATTALSSLGVVWLAENLSPRIRAYGVSLYGAAGSLGAGLAILGLPLAERDWRLPYLISLAGLALLPLLARRIGESPLVLHSTKTNWDFAAIVRSRWFTRAGLASLFPAAFSSFGLAFTTERMVRQLGLTTGQAVAVTLVGGTIGGVGFFLGGRLADSWGRKPTTLLALMCVLVGGLAVYHVDRIVWLLLALVVSSFGSFAYVPAASTHRAELFPTQTRATGAATLTWMGTFGSALGLAAGTFLIGRMGLAGTMDILGLGVVASIVTTVFLPETRGRQLTSA